MRATVILVAAVISLTGCATVAAGATTPRGEVTAFAPPSPDATATPSPAPPTVSTASPSVEPTPSAAPPSGATTPATPSAKPTAPATPSPSPSVPASDPAPVGSFVLGDSIALSVAPLMSRFGYPVTGRVGQSAHAAFLEQHLSSSDAQLAPGWVLVLGTNNRGDLTDITRLPEWIDLIASLRTPGAKQQVYWVTPHRPDAYTGGLSAWSLLEFNAELARLAQEHRWLHVIDFASAAMGHPEWFAEDGGHLHPNPDGQRALAALIAGPDATPATSAARITALEWPTPAASATPEASEYEVFGSTVE